MYITIFIKGSFFKHETKTATRSIVPVPGISHSIQMERNRMNVFISYHLLVKRCPSIQNSMILCHNETRKECPSTALEKKAIYLFVKSKFRSPKCSAFLYLCDALLDFMSGVRHGLERFPGYKEHTLILVLQHGTWILSVWCWHRLLFSLQIQNIVGEVLQM